jgi:hypothetical protein
MRDLGGDLRLTDCLDSASALLHETVELEKGVTAPIAWSQNLVVLGWVVQGRAETFVLPWLFNLREVNATPIDVMLEVAKLINVTGLTRTGCDAIPHRNSTQQQR